MAYNGFDPGQHWFSTVDNRCNHSQQWLTIVNYNDGQACNGSGHGQQWHTKVMLVVSNGLL